MGVGSCEICGTPSASNLCGSCRARFTARLAGQPTERARAPRRSGPERRVTAPGDAGPVHRIARSLIAPPGAMAEKGSLLVEGNVGPGWRIFAEDDLTVVGMVERARLEAGIGALTLRAACRGSEMFAGLLREPLARLSQTVGEADRDLLAISQGTVQLLAAAAIRGDTLSEADAFRRVTAHRAPDLPSRLSRAIEILGGLGATGGETLTDLHNAVHALSRAVAAGSSIDTVAARAGDLTDALDTSRSIAGRPPTSVMEGLHGCRVTCAGSLEIRGQGARDCRIAVGGDLTLIGRNAALVGGETRISGNLMAERIGGSGAATSIVIEGGRRGGRITAGVVSPGVEIRHGERSLAFPKEERDVTVSIAGERLEMIAGRRR